MSCTPSRPAILRTFLCAFLALLVTTAGASAQTFTSLASFDGANGQNPYNGPLVQGLDGKLYGTTYAGGANGTGSVFKVSTSGAIMTLYSFCPQDGCLDGANPVAGLTLGSNGNFYGTTSGGGADGGYGSVFEITAAGKLTTLHSFDGTDGAEPTAALIQAANGSFYGTTPSGGAGDDGTIFEITSAGKFTPLHSFAGTDGSSPYGSLIQASNGNFYGTTYGGGSGNGGSGGGTFFEMTLAGKLTTLYNFCSLEYCEDGTQPYGGVIQASNGNLYGTTTSGGLPNGNGGFPDAGTVFEITPEGSGFTSLYSFDTCIGACTDGSAPYGQLIQGTDGNLYGTTSAGGAKIGGGTIFQITLAGALTTIFNNFCPNSSCPNGDEPYAQLVEDTSGVLYGTTHLGGASNMGAVFSLSDGLPPFVKTVANSGKVGAKVTILGSKLTGSTAVSFNGTAATFKVLSSSEISATVPAGATTGTITVTTPSGTLATRLAFLVTPQITSFIPPSGTVGTTVTITGVSLTETSKVTFGGVSASFTVDSDTQVTATVPTGAKMGKIMITTPGGTASSASNFTVTT